MAGSEGFPQDVEMDMNMLGALDRPSSHANSLNFGGQQIMR